MCDGRRAAAAAAAWRGRVAWREMARGRSRRALGGWRDVARAAVLDRVGQQAAALKQAVWVWVCVWVWVGGCVYVYIYIYI